MTEMRKKADRRKDDGDARDRILRSALALFAERGFDGTATKAIAEHANVPSGLLFYYFSSKEQLLEVILSEDNWYDAFRRLSETLPDGPVLERFTALALGMLQWMERNRERSLLFFQEMTSHRRCAATLRRTRQQLMHDLAALLEVEMKRGTLHGSNATMLSHVLTAGILVAAIVDQPNQQKRYAAAIIDCILGPLAGQPRKRAAS